MKRVQARARAADQNKTTNYYFNLSCLVDAELREDEPLLRWHVLPGRGNFRKFTL